MIRFFRSIRQGLVNEGKTSKYFRYAIGEILLVVMGILIALQVNNWNIARGEAKLEQEYIQRLIADIEGDVEDIARWTRLSEWRAGYGQLLKEAVKDTQVAIDNPVEFLVAIKQIYMVVSLVPSRDTFEELRSTGYLRLLKDKHLKALLFEHFNFDEEIRIRGDAGQMLVPSYIEQSNEILNFQHTDLMFPIVGPGNIDEIRKMEVDKTLVIDTLNRLRESPDLLTSLEFMHGRQLREVRVNALRKEKAEALLNALKAAQEEGR